MTAFGVIPAKRFSGAKSRLAGVLDPAARANLARALFEHVLAVAKGALDAVIVITDGDDVEEIAARAGAIVLRDPPEARLGAIVDAAIAEATRRGAAEIVVLMGDLPRLAQGDVRALRTGLLSADVVVSPDRRDEGTNALAIRVGAIERTAFGNPDSFARHRARPAGAAVHRAEGLAFDVDTEGDWGSLDREN